jgi:DNA gyrase inhibitor GyrI
MNLTEKPETVTWPATHYVYIEKIGPFQETAMKAWQELHSKMSEIAKQCKITGGMSLYKIKPQMIYRAGHIVDTKLKTPIEGLQYLQFEGGKYAKFTLKGSYSNLPQASGKVMELVKTLNLALRDDFYIENYVNNPATTPEDQLITEILVPIQ